MNRIKQARKKLFWHDVFLSVAVVILLCLIIESLTLIGRQGATFLFFVIFVTSIIIISVLWLMRKSLLKRYNAIQKFFELSDRYGFPTEGLLETVFDFCYNSRITYYCENGAGYITDKTFFYFWEKDDTYNFLEMPKEKLVTISEKDLISYTVTGDKKYITKVTGGGGGGSSLGGAVVGGVLGGATGAVIGSRKSTQPVTTDVITLDNQNTIVNCMINGESVHLVFKGRGIYDELIRLSPSKELNILDKTVRIDMNSNDKTASERLKQLKELFDNGLISTEEYETKRKEILSEI